MGIHIDTLNSSNYLPILGSGDWLIFIPQWPDLCVSAAWRKQLRHTIAKQFTYWAIKSAEAQTPPHDVQVLIGRYTTLAHWMAKELCQPTANLLGTCKSEGETFKASVMDYVQECVTNLLREHAKPIGCEDPKDTAWDKQWQVIIEDASCMEPCLVEALTLEIGQLATRYAWQQANWEVQADIEETKKRAKLSALRHAHNLRLVRHFCERYLPELLEQRVEMPQFNAWGWAALLEDLFADAAPEVVKAFTEVRLPYNCSNTVRDAIKHLARAALL